MARFVPNNEGFYALRSHPKVIADLERRARIVKAVAESTGGEYEIESRQGAKDPQGRWRVTVITADWEARRKEAREFTLISAMDAARH